MKFIKYISILVILIIATSFAVKQKKSKEELIKERIEQRSLDYKNQQLEDCFEKALKEAEARVDSIIAIELGAGPIDTVDFPRKPIKPSFEPYDSVRPIDVQIKPLFESEDNKDYQ